LVVWIFNLGIELGIWQINDRIISLLGFFFFLICLRFLLLLVFLLSLGIQSLLRNLLNLLKKIIHDVLCNSWSRVINWVGFVYSEELNGWIALYVIWLSNWLMQSHIHSSNSYYSFKSLGSFEVLRGKGLTVTAPGSVEFNKPNV
jgi:hypothetical protein